MNFDFTISLGHLIAIGGFVATGFGVIFAVRNDVAVISSRLDPLEAAILKLTDILERLGRQDERLKNIERDLERVYAGQKGSKPRTW